jgi:heat-inducible transcriptional repressor
MLLQDLNPRASAILRLIVDSYVASGDAVGSRTLSKDLARMLGMNLSPATIRSAMADLEEAGLLFSEHTSAGRLPTDAGLRLFVNSLMEVKKLDPAHKAEIEQQLDYKQNNLPEMLERASVALSSLSQCAGLVAAPKKDRPFKQVEFVALNPGRVLVVWVAEDGGVENRLLEVDPRLSPSELQKASNYLNHHLFGRTMDEARLAIMQEIQTNRTALDQLTKSLVEKGIAIPTSNEGMVIVRGQAHLLNDVREVTELDRLRKLFETLEQRETLLRLVDQTATADGVQIFIGAQSELFNHSGCAMIVAPYKNKDQQVIGAIGVIGPARLNYGRIIPMVDFTAKILSGAA